MASSASNRLTRARLIQACAAAAVLAFFLPWARLDLSMGELERSISKGMKTSVRKTFGTTKKAPKRAKKGASAIPTVVRGYEIPLLANRKNAKVAMQLVKAFTKKDERIGLKSWAVYLLPGLAALCGWLLIARAGRPAARVAAGTVCAAVALGGLFFLATTDTRKEYAIVIGPGIWLSLAAYAGLAACAFRERMLP